MKNWNKGKRLHANLSQQWTKNKKPYLTLQIRPPNLYSKYHGVEIIETKNGQLQKPTYKEFKTKSSALKFAKSYMKKN